MYSEKKIAERIASAETMLGFRLQRHDLSSVIAANDLLDSIYDPETGSTTRPLKPSEIRWIRNERALCRCDYNYWATHYAFIKNWENQIVRYKPNIAQQIIHSIQADMEERELEIIIQALKARQLGVSTDTELKVTHRTCFYAGVNATVGSNDPDKSWKMSQMMELCYALMPWWMKPQRTKYKAGVLIEYGLQNGVITIQHGTQTSGIGRGDTPTVVHLSELADYDNPEELVDAALLRALHPSPYVFCVFESTAKGRHNWWHRTWNFAKENYHVGRARMCPVFLPWYVGTDLYPTATWKHGHPVPANWSPATLTANHAEKAANYVRGNALLRKYLGAKWQMSREQMWWWEVTREEHKAKNELPQFQSELCSDDLEAFTSTNHSVFEVEVISEYREAAGQKDPVAVLGVTGDDIPVRMEPDRRDIDANKKPIEVTYSSNAGITKRFSLVPLKFNGYSTCDPNGKLFLWEWPKDEEEYGLGIDTGEGIGLDQSVIEVLRKGTFTRNDSQICEFSSKYINAHDLAPISLAVGQLFSTRLRGEYQMPKMVIECAGNGESVQHELRKLGWAHFHQWVRYDSKADSQEPRAEDGMGADAVGTRHDDGHGHQVPARRLVRHQLAVVRGRDAGLGARPVCRTHERHVRRSR
jgi:hypothetical protein